MKTRRRHVPFGDSVHPSGFDYTLLNHLHIHDDGNDVIDFAGLPDKHESTHEVQTLLRNLSFIGASTTAARSMSAASASHARAALLHLQGDDPVNTAAAAEATEANAAREVRREVSRLVSVENTESHIWLVAQPSEDRPPYARMFPSPDALMEYIAKHGMEIPVRGQKRRPSRQPHHHHAEDGLLLGQPSSPTTAADKDVPFPMPQRRREQGPLPTTRWIDVQADPNDPNTNAMLRRLLSHFPVDENTIDNCLYLTPTDTVDTTRLSSRTASYAFFTITCTPLQGIDYGAGPQGKEAARGHGLSAHQRLRRRFRRRRAEDTDTGREEQTAQSRETRNTKGVMELRFEAVRLDLPRSAVPDPVPVAVVAFADWIITVHEKPFAEMDDLLRTIQLHCSPRSREPRQASTIFVTSPTTTSTLPQQRFTTAFVFTNLLQISIGHHLDSVALAQAVDELGDVVFDVKRTDKEQDKVMQRITAVRRCFGECGADVTRRENVVATLLQPNLAHNFLLRDAGTREQLLNTQAHVRYVQHELSDCRDTVAVSNWYHNVALQWILLRRGNRALRQLLQLTEMANIMYPVITIQTLYSINVPVPFGAERDPPNTSLVPFFVLAAVIVIYTLLCSRAMYRMFKRTPFETRLLA